MTNENDTDLDIDDLSDEEFRELIAELVERTFAGEAEVIPVININTGRYFGDPGYDDMVRGRPRSFLSDDGIIEQHFDKLDPDALPAKDKAILVDLLANLSDDQWRVLSDASFLNTQAFEAAGDDENA